MKKTIGMDDLIATYMTHLSEKYKIPHEFGLKLDVLLAEKRNRAGPEEYMGTLEKNIVFFSDLIVEGEALIDIFLRPKKGRGGSDIDLNELLSEMDRKVRAKTDERHRKIFGGKGGEEFAELVKLKKSGDPLFVERLEFNYKYLMTLKILLFEFLSVLDSIASEYEIDPGEGGAGKRIIDSVKMAANFYIGNIDITSGNNGSPEVM